MRRMHFLAIGFVSACLALVAVSARAELATWDQAKVTALARQLASDADALYDTFYKQPPPTVGSMQSRAYQQLKQEIRRIRLETRELASALEKGEGQEATTPIYEHLMQIVRDARDHARQVFTTTDVAERASAARAGLNQLGPYYDPDFQAYQPPAR